MWSLNPTWSRQTVSSHSCVSRSFPWKQRDKSCRQAQTLHNPPPTQRDLQPRYPKAKQFEPPDPHSQDFPSAPHSPLAIAPSSFKTHLSTPTLSPPKTTETPTGSLILPHFIQVKQHRMHLQKREVTGKQAHHPNSQDMRIRGLAFQCIGKEGFLYFVMSWRTDTALGSSSATQG